MVVDWTALQLQQTGVRVSGGAEAAVHAMRRLVENLPSDRVIVKLDFSNAFNCIRCVSLNRFIWLEVNY